MRVIRYEDPEGTVSYAAQTADGEAYRIEGNLFGRFEITNAAADVSRLLAPVEPAIFLGIGVNYREHAEETGASVPDFPVLFCKGSNTLQHPGDPILLPTHLKSEQVDYECELAVVIGKRCKNVSREEALSYVLGYTCANDVSARDWQLEKGGGQWCRGKFFDTFSPLGPCLVTAEEVPDPNDLQIRTMLNDETVQHSHTGDMIFDVPALIEFLSGSTTLLPGTVILTGTPHGIGMAQEPQRWLREGDTVHVEIEGIGTLSNPVRNE